MAEQAQVKAAETQLRTDFIRLVGGLSVCDLAAPIRDRRSAKNESEFPIENYEFCSIVPNTDDARALSTSEPIGQETAVLDSRAQLIDAALPLDAGRGIALAYRRTPGHAGRVVCYSGAGVFSHCGTIFITQLQGHLPQEQREFYKESLRAGFWWADTLVGAWAAIARKIGATGVQIVPSSDIDWLKDTDPELNKKIAAKYDETAKRLHFKKDELGAWARMF